MNPNAKTTKSTPPTTEQIRAEQKRQADKGRAAQQAAAAEKAAANSTAVVPATTTSTAVASLDNRPAQQRYLDEISPASIVGRMIKFNGKDGKYLTPDDGEAIGDDVDFIVLADQTLVGYVKFGAEGEPPDRIMGLLYDGFIPPKSETLSDRDELKWEIGLDGRPADPWQHHIYLVLQGGDTGELFTFVTSSATGRRAVGNLLRHYDRLPPDLYPVIRLKVGGFQHRDDRVGWVSTPVFTVVGRAPKDSAVRPDTSLKAQMSDEIPF